MSPFYQNQGFICKNSQLTLSAIMLSLNDDLALAILARVPFLSHGATRAVCRRLDAMLSSPAFREERQSSGYAERALILAGGRAGKNQGRTAECWLRANSGRFLRPIAPLFRCRSSACAAIFDGEMLVIGGTDGAGELATVEAYRPRTLRAVAHVRVISQN